MEQIYHLGAAATAGMLSGAGADSLAICTCFLIAAGAAVGALLAGPSRGAPMAAPVPVHARRPPPRPAPPTIWR